MEEDTSDKQSDPVDLEDIKEPDTVSSAPLSDDVNEAEFVRNMGFQEVLKEIFWVFLPLGVTAFGGPQV